jgi:hypothetical protein
MSIDVRHVDAHVPLHRLDQHLFHTPPDQLGQASLQAYAEHGEFYRIYIEEILQGAPLDHPELTVFLSRFITDPDWSTVQESIDSVFPDLEPERERLEMAFRRLKAVFPEAATPKVVTFNSGFNYGIFPTDSVLGVGLEWFIGADHPVIGMLAPDAFPQFVKDRMHPDMLVPSAVKGWLFVHYLQDATGEDVLTNLVETGKVMALLDALLPQAPQHLLFAFTPEQLAWCEANEYNIWKEIVAGDKLFSRKPADINRLMNDAPFTSGFPRESPGHIGEWIGYRMVTSYLQSNTRVTFPELFEIDDPRLILRFYKPR